MIPFIDCQGLAGAWSLGTVQTGKFRLLDRMSLTGGFGDEVMDGNRDLLGNQPWNQFTGDPESTWPARSGVGFLCGTPPCSGFSLLNISKGPLKRGPDSAINSCMRELVGYAGSRVTGSDGKPGPEVVAFESVQGAYTQGRGLMQALRDDLSTRTGQPYELFHVLMSGSSVGAAQMRHRYFPVFHRIPFGVEPPAQRNVVTYQEAIGDLIGLDMQWDDQPYKQHSNAVQQLGYGGEYGLQRRRSDGYVGDHVTLDHGRLASVIPGLVAAGWEPGESMPEAMIRTGYHPPSLQHNRYDDGTYKGWSWPRMIKADRPGYVLTGGGIHGFVHWAEPRLLTVREMSRLMGYPDAWKWPTNRPNQASMWIGKCCPVTSGAWISDWVARAIEGNPGKDGTVLAPRERMVNYTNLYKDWPGGATARKVKSNGE